MKRTEAAHPTELASFAFYRGVPIADAFVLCKKKMGVCRSTGVISRARALPSFLSHFSATLVNTSGGSL